MDSNDIKIDVGSFFYNNSSLFLDITDSLEDRINYLGRLEVAFCAMPVFEILAACALYGAAMGIDPGLLDGTLGNVVINLAVSSLLIGIVGGGVSIVKGRAEAKLARDAEVQHVILRSDEDVIDLDQQ